MKLTDHSLRQLDEEYLAALDEEALRGLSLRLLADLKEARERLNQTPENSSRPPSSREPWKRGGSKEPSDECEAEPFGDPDAQGSAPSEESEDPASRSKQEPDGREASGQGKESRRCAGKQPGSPGFGRQQRLMADEQVDHWPDVCAGCGCSLGPESSGSAYTGFQVIDVDWNDRDRPGLPVRVTDHRYYESVCACGHRTRAVAGEGSTGPTFDRVQLKEWRLVGPGLATLIVALNMRFRLSRARTHEFLYDTLGIALSVGTIQATIEEAGAALGPVEEKLVEELLESELIHADETSWPEQQQSCSLWLWVWVSSHVTLYYIAGRGKELVESMLGGYQGWLMSDGWQAYRHYLRRVRCWAHLQRKAKGLIDSMDQGGRQFGKTVDDTLTTLMHAIYAAREGPPQDLMLRYAAELEALRKSCEQCRDHAHQKTRALAVELLNDWDAIVQVLRIPSLPLTNNLAERALRHWVISRLISQGTRTETGSRVFAITASVIDTCHQRRASPWPYIRDVIAARRAGHEAPCLPQPAGV